MCLHAYCKCVHTHCTIDLLSLYTAATAGTTPPKRTPHAPHAARRTNTMDKFPWHRLPADVQTQVLSYVPLPDMLSAVQLALPGAAGDAARRIAALQPLWEAWCESPMEVRNVIAYRPRAARLACTPAAFASLDRLILGSSALVRLPAAVAELAHTVKVLHLDENLLSDLPPALARCKHLLLLDCSENRFQSIPEAVLHIPSLHYVLFSQNTTLSVIPDGLARMPGLRAVEFYNCALKRLPDSLVTLMVGCDNFLANLASNNFPRGYLANLCRQYPTFKRKLANALVEGPSSPDVVD